MNFNDNLKHFFTFFIAILKLARSKTSFLVALTVACGYLLQLAELNGQVLELPTILAGIASGFLLMAAANTLNDVVDSEADRVMKPERVIPSGVIDPKIATIIAIIELFVGMIFLLYLGVMSFLIAVSVVMLGVLYSLYLQSYPFVKNVLVGISISSALLVGAFASSSDLSPKVMVVFMASLVAFTAFELHKDIGDISGDEKIGKRTIPLILGVNQAFRLAYALYVVAFLMIVIGLLLLSKPLIIVVIIGGIGAGALLFMSPSLKKMDVNAIHRQRVLMMIAFAVMLVTFLIESILALIMRNNR